MSTYFPKRLYPVVDAADKGSCRPDFAVVIYPGHLSLSAAQWDATEPMKKIIPTGTPSCELAPLRTTLRPCIQLRRTFACWCAAVFLERSASRGISGGCASKKGS